MRKCNEECGVFGVFGNEVFDAARMTYYGLYALQHRGQEACGIVVNNDGLFRTYKDAGLVNEVFTQENLNYLGMGNCAVGHVRYATTGGSERNNAQPIVVNHIKGRLALAHNGNLVNSAELRRELELNGSIFHTTGDTEVISYMITKARLTSGSIEEAIEKAAGTLKGAFSLVMMSPQKMIALRDPNAFRPLCYGRTASGVWVVASESCALDSVGAEFIRDLNAGEMLVFDKTGVRSIQTDIKSARHSMCVFEYIYFARPDSVIDGCCVHTARSRAGAFLALEHPVQADVVIGVPDSGLDAAVGYARQSGIPYEIGFIKNKYIGRTFIAPGQAQRENLVHIKLNPIKDVVCGKRVILIDDSIVRGTTSAGIVHLLREAGATEIHMRITAPPFTNPCYYGTDIDSRENLIACGHTVKEIAKLIGVDTLGYLSVENAKKLAGGNEGMGYCTACFDGDYPGGIPKYTEKDRFEKGLSENKEDDK